MTAPDSLPSRSDRLWACHTHAMIGNQQEAHGHRQAHGCEVEELSQEVSDAVRAEWRKQATYFDPALAVEIMRRRRSIPDDEPEGSGPFGF